MAKAYNFFSCSLFIFFWFISSISLHAEAAVKTYKFDVSNQFYWSYCILVLQNKFDLICFFCQVQVKNVSRLCHAKPIVTVNGMFPGPTIYVREGDRVLVNVTNNAQYNMSIHW